MEEKRYWFKNKRFGIGWRPATWEGWLAMFIFALWAVGVSVRFEKLGLPERAILEQLVFPIFFGVFVLIVVSVKTGEPLQWRWRRNNHVQMRLHEEPFLKIQSGQKNIEVRLYDEKRSQLRNGDYITFISRQNPDAVVRKRVKALHRFDTFEDVFAAYPAERTDAYRYYSRDDEERLGVVAIELQ